MGKFMMKRIVLTGAVLLGSLLSLNAMAAAEQTPEEKAAADVKTRQSIFQLLSFSNANGPAGMARGVPFNIDGAKLGAERIKILAGMIPQAFAADTRGVAGLTTRASDTIWDNKADFDKLAADLEAGATQALEILNTKGEAGLRDAVGAIGPKCGACHDRFRLE